MAIYLGGDDAVILTTSAEVLVSDQGMPSTADRHEPVWPSGDCLGCCEPYPCEQGRVQMIAVYAGFTPELAMRAVELMEQAIVAGLPLDGLFERFVEWTAPLIGDHR
jgi:hypothetical protein